MRCRPIALLVLLLAACPAGGRRAARPAADEPGLPTLWGTPVLDLPLDEARPPARRAYRLARQMGRHRLPPRPMAAGETDRWASEILAPWLARQRQRARRVDEHLAELEQRDPREGLFSSVAHGVVYYDLLEQVVAAAPGDDAVLPLVAQARRGFELCVARAPRAPAPLQAWGALCRARLRALPPPAASIATAMPAECRPDGDRGARRRAPPPDGASPMEVAVLAERGVGSASGALRLEAAARARLDELLDVALLPSSEVEAAHRLDAERRLGVGGPVCAAPPGVERILALDHPHLVVARLRRRCVHYLAGSTRPARTECSLEADFERPGAPEEREGLPGRLAARLGPEERSEGALVDAAGRLSAEEAAAVDALVGGLAVSSRALVRVLPGEGQDPLLDVSDALLADATHDAVVACVGEPPPDLEALATSLRVRLEISPTGAVLRATAEPLTPPPGRSDGVARCVERALLRSRWPCPPSGAPTSVEATVCVLVE